MKRIFTHRFRTDLKRSVGVATTTQLVWLNCLSDDYLDTYHKSNIIERTMYVRNIVDFESRISPYGSILLKTAQKVGRLASRKPV